MPGAIDPHTHIEMFFGGTTTCDDFTSGTTSAAFGGTTTVDRLLHADARRHVRPGAREVPREDRALHAGDRRRLPHRRHRPAHGRHARGSREAARRGRHVVQAVHGLQGRRHGRRRHAVQDDAECGRHGRARHGARRERRRDRPHRQEGGGGGQDRADLARADAADGDGGRGDEPRHPAGARRGLPAVRRPRLLPAGSRADRARAREGLGRVGRDVHAVPLRRRERARPARLRGREVHLHAAAAAEGAPGASLEGAPVGRALGGLDRPLPVQLARAEGHQRRASSRSCRTVAPGSRTGCTCCTTSACARDGSRSTASSS